MVRIGALVGRVSDPKHKLSVYFFVRKHSGKRLSVSPKAEAASVGCGDLACSYSPRVAALCPILFPTCSTDVALIPHTEKDRVGSKSVDDAAWTKWAGIWTQRVTVRVLVNHGRGRTQPCSLQRLPLPPR